MDATCHLFIVVVIIIITIIIIIIIIIIFYFFICCSLDQRYQSAYINTLIYEPGSLWQIKNTWANTHCSIRCQVSKWR